MITSEVNLANAGANAGANTLDYWRDKLIAPNNRYIVAKVGDRLVTFPDVLISEIMIVERNAILALPFYEPAIVGVIHHQANVMPLVLLRLIMGEQRSLMTESLTVIRLSKIANVLSDKNLDGIGVIVDRVVGSLTNDEYKDIDLNISKLSDNLSDNLSGQISDKPSEQLVSPIAATDSTKKITQIVANIKETEYTPIEIVLSSTSTHIWQPQRWQIPN